MGVKVTAVFASFTNSMLEVRRVGVDQSVNALTDMRLHHQKGALCQDTIGRLHLLLCSSSGKSGPTGCQAGKNSRTTTLSRMLGTCDQDALALWVTDNAHMRAKGWKTELEVYTTSKGTSFLTNIFDQHQSAQNCLTGLHTF